ncbi:MAG: DNA glycosylase [Armatimonadota bacterium]|nr:DNA glycosylase [Armatimonadota bacterium]
MAVRPPIADHEATTFEGTSFSLPRRGLDLRRTLECGQVFRYRWADGTAVIVAGAAVLRVRSDRWRLHVRSRMPAEHVERYLWGWGPIRPLERDLARDPVLAAVLPHTRGISILGQDPWETLATFVISQNNNIPKIRLSVDRLCAALGEPSGTGQDAYFAFPDPARLADAPERLLRDAAVGYRAPYLRALARRIAEGDPTLEDLAAAPFDRARAALLDLPGVGEKVAECVLLFGLGHRQAFPVDVWVQRAVESLYFGGHRRRPRDIQTFARDRFGPLAGLAQQHLFHFARIVRRSAV